MIDLGVFDLETDLFLLMIAAFVFVLQLFLCLRIKRRWLRLLPVMAFSVAVAVFALLAFFADGWDRIGFMLLALWTALLFIPCALARFISYLIRRKSK